jgi:hypothetical protein
MKIIKIILLGKAANFSEDFLDGLRNSLGNNLFTKTAFTKGIPMIQFKPLPKNGHSRFIQKVFFTKNKPLIILYPQKPDREVLGLILRSKSIRHHFYSLGPSMNSTLARTIFFYQSDGTIKKSLLRI